MRPSIGNIYSHRQKEIVLFDSFSIEQQQNFILHKMQSIVNYSYNNVHFYKEYYDRMKFHPEDLKEYRDIQEIPITNKIILREYDLEKRSAVVPDRFIVNTGGSSGIPFGFYIEPNSIGHEWAHMHKIWGKLGYKMTDIKLNFSGRSNIKEIIEYDPLRNHFAVDLYKNYELVALKIKEIIKKYPIKYLHGYPSSIYNFALYCKERDIDLKNALSEQLQGAFLGSEYPYPHYRNTIEDVFGINTISWYGHTERCILAYENKEKYIYEPFYTYGFVEAVAIDGESQLVGTSYYNHASPLIRYNTNDIISGVEENGILKSFKITKGRDGDFVYDRQGNKINLTALIFGRHHKLFNVAKFIQVKPIGQGRIEIHFVASEVSEKMAEQLFDGSNVDLSITFIKRNSPVMTASGKINLLINDPSLSQ
jgi:phenylacetate-CoA ligase